jgi:hypothetical protein
MTGAIWIVIGLVIGLVIGAVATLCWLVANFARSLNR